MEEQQRHTPPSDGAVLLAESSFLRKVSFLGRAGVFFFLSTGISTFSCSTFGQVEG